MTTHRIYKTSFASVNPYYVAKAEKKGRTKAEVDRIITICKQARTTALPQWQAP